MTVTFSRITPVYTIIWARPKELPVLPAIELAAARIVKTLGGLL
jgi:hypothetical protein